MKKFAVVVAVVAMAMFAVPAMASVNPFMDVPASHWAYDAVASLASRGVLSGFPDGAFKGAQGATRYEMASALARGLANLDAEKAGRQDIETLKKLVAEFKDELDALGVKLGALDERVAVIEDDLGGWRIAGELIFSAYLGNGVGEDCDGFYTAKETNEFRMDRYRLFLRKRVNETTRFTTRIGGDNLDWERYYVETQIGYGIWMLVGHQNLDWEDELDLYIGDDAYVATWTGNMIAFRKDWGMASFQLFFGRQNDDKGNPENPNQHPDGPRAGLEENFAQHVIGGLLNFDVSEQFRAGVLSYYYITDTEYVHDDAYADITPTDTDLLIVGAYAGFRFVPGAELKGVYYWQDLGKSWQYTVLEDNYYGNPPDLDDTASAWKVILDVDQDILKCTSLWLEYGQIDNHFARFVTGTHTDFDFLSYGRTLLDNRPFDDDTTNLYGFRADQRWNDKWRTFVSYFVAEFGEGIDDTTDLTLGVAYRLNPAVEFEFAYDLFDYGDGPAGGVRTGDEGVFLFRTYVTF